MDASVNTPQRDHTRKKCHAWFAKKKKEQINSAKVTINSAKVKINRQRSPKDICESEAVHHERNWSMLACFYLHDHLLSKRETFVDGLRKPNKLIKISTIE